MFFFQKQIKERSKLRPTQSLPSNDRYAIDEAESDFKRYNKQISNDSENMMKNLNYDKAENQFRRLMISKGVEPPSPTSHHLTSSSSSMERDDIESFDRIDRPIRMYNIEKANKNLYTGVEDAQIYHQSQQQQPKQIIRRVDSGPSPQRRGDNRYTSNSSDLLPTMTTSSNLRNSNQEIEIVFVSDMERSPKLPSRNLDRTKLLERRDLVCRSTGDENFSTSSASSVNTSPSWSSAYSLQNTPTSISSSIPKDKVTFMSVPNKDKAAAVLGTKSDNLSRNEALIRSRRVKSNLIDEFSSHPNPTIELTNTIRRGVGVSGTVSVEGGPPTETLRRRNSDPTYKIPLLEVNRGNDMYQSSTHINIAGHQFRKANRINKAEKCASCKESDAFVNEGYRCLDCKLLVHTKCIQNGGVKTLQCEAKRSRRLRSKNIDKTGGHSQNSIYSGTREYTDSADKIISDAKELQKMQDFITQKIINMDSDGGNSSEVDNVFRQALREFKDNLVAQYSVANKQNSDALNIKYKDLIANFEQIMITCSGRKNDFPLTMGVNAFRGFMNEFMSSRETEKPKAKRKKEKRRKIEDHTNYNGHTFQSTIINIATACEICTQFLLWPIERGLICQNCRLTCHKKCYQKAANCKNSNISGSMNADNSSSQNVTSESKLFGVSLQSLCMQENSKIPTQIEQLMMKIEMLGLYAEGIYRKSGVSSKIKDLKMKMSEPDFAEIDYESYNVHVLTNVLKSFLREMPEPLLTFDRYDDFLRAADLEDTQDRVNTLMALIKKLSPCHHTLLERLIFHLALVAQREQYNRMSASSLAIVFAPCVLRTNRLIPAQDSLNDIGRQTKCIETLITQKMLNVKSTLADIDTLDTAAHTATTRLSTLRSSKVFTPEELLPRQQNMETDAEEMLLEGHIQEIQKEKAHLTSTLPSLARANSDDDLLSTDLDGESGSLDDLSRDCPSKDSIDSKSIDNSDEMIFATPYSIRDQSDIKYPNQTKMPSKSTPSTSSSSSSTTQSRTQLNQTSTGSVGSVIGSGNNGGLSSVSQKPAKIMRSISGGYYDVPTIYSTTRSQPTISGGISPQDVDIVMDNLSKESKNNNNRKAKRQSSLDDEPIMV